MKNFYFSLLASLMPFLTFAQIPTNDMESWRAPTAGVSTPTTVEAAYKWYGSDSTIIALGQTLGSLAGADDTDWRRQIFKEPTIVHGGSYSAKIMTRKEWTYTIPGVLANAIPSVGLAGFPTPSITAVTLKGGTPISAKPTTVTAWVQYYKGIGSIDSGSIAVQALGQVGGKDSVIGTGYVTIGPTSTWVQVTVNVTYPIHTNVPVDTFRIALSSGKAQSGLDSSTLYVDDLAMTTITNPDNSGVTTIKGNEFVSVYPNPASGTVNIRVLQGADLNCKLVDTRGRIVIAKKINGDDKLDVANLAGGLYFYTIEDSNGGLLQNGKLNINK